MKAVTGVGEGDSFRRAWNLPARTSAQSIFAHFLKLDPTVEIIIEKSAGAGSHDNRGNPGPDFFVPRRGDIDPIALGERQADNGRIVGFWVSA